jgi:protein TonB
MTQTVTKKWGLLGWRLMFIGVLFLLQDWAFAALGEPGFIQGNPAEKTGNISLAISFKLSPASLATASATSTVTLADSSAAALPVTKSKPAEAVVEQAVKKIPLTPKPVVLAAKKILSKRPLTAQKAPVKIAVEPKPVTANTVAKAVFSEKHTPSIAPSPPQTQSPVPAESLSADTQLQRPIQHHAGSVGKRETIITEPVFAAQPKPPRYPTVARKRGQEGTVWLDIWLDEKGNKSKLEITHSSGLTLLDKSALKAVSGWHFKPYEKNGIRIASRVRIPVVFSLN